MSRIARVEVDCNGEKHHVSVWEPGDEYICNEGYLFHGLNGQVICYEDHDELEKTVTELTGENPRCFDFTEELKIMPKEPYLILIGFDEDGPVQKMTKQEEIEQILVMRLMTEAADGNLDLMIFMASYFGIDINDDFILEVCFRAAAENGHLKVLMLFSSMTSDLYHYKEGLRLAYTNEHWDAVKFLEEKIKKLRGTP